MSLKRVILIVLFFALFYFIIRTGTLIYNEYKADKEIEKIIGEGNWAVRYEMFLSEKIRKNATVFIGDSHVENFDLSCFFDTLIINRGISGDVTEGVLKRLPEFYRFNPKKIFIEIGLNDILINVPLNRIASNYNRIVHEIIKNSPDAKVYVQSLIPTEKKSVNKKILLLNAELMHICKEQRCSYIDLYELFLKENIINSDLFSDGFHLNKAGYKVWEKEIFKYVSN